jgi:hypothetical protein
MWGDILSLHPSSPSLPLLLGYLISQHNTFMCRWTQIQFFRFPTIGLFQLLGNRIFPSLCNSCYRTEYFHLFGSLCKNISLLCWYNILFGGWAILNGKLVEFWTRTEPDWCLMLTAWPSVKIYDFRKMSYWFCSVNVFQSILDKLEPRLAMLAGNCTALSMEYNLMGRCLQTKL